ncbi:hypothetical protein ACQ7B2_00360, partial [Escherichia coli]
VQIPLVDAGGPLQELDAYLYVDPDAEPLPPPAPFCTSRTSGSLFCADFDDALPDLADGGAADGGTVQTDRGQLQVVSAIAASP